MVVPLVDEIPPKSVCMSMKVSGDVEVGTYVGDANCVVECRDI